MIRMHNSYYANIKIIQSSKGFIMLAELFSQFNCYSQGIVAMRSRVFSKTVTLKSSISLNTQKKGENLVSLNTTSF